MFFSVYHESDAGVVLQSRPYGEFDALLTVFAEQHGRLGLLAKGVRRPRAKLAGILQPFCAVQLEWRPSSHADGLCKLIRAEALNQGLTKYDPAFLFIAEVAGKLAQAGQGSGQFYRLLTDLATTHKPERAVLVFLVRALTIYGYFPEFRQCPQCPDKFAAAGRWQPSGEILCEAHSSAGTPLSFDEIKTLRFWQHAAFADGEHVALDDAAQHKLLHHLIAVVETEVEITLKSKALVF